jgi:hypothetical protein
MNAGSIDIMKTIHVAATGNRSRSAIFVMAELREVLKVKV